MYARKHAHIVRPAIRFTDPVELHVGMLEHASTSPATIFTSCVTFALICFGIACCYARGTCSKDQQVTFEQLVREMETDEHHYQAGMHVFPGLELSLEDLHTPKMAFDRI